MTAAVLEERNLYLSDFERLEPKRRRSDPSWLTPIRQAAIARFGEMGFPTLDDEEWRFTNVAPIARTRFALPDGERGDVTLRRLESFLYCDAECPRLVFVNGRYRPELSSPEAAGVRLSSLADALRGDCGALQPHLAQYADFDDHAFAALNTAFVEDGAVVIIPKGKVIEQPIHLLFVAVPAGEPTVTYPRVLIRAEPNSQATVVESYVGLSEGYLTNAVTEIVAADNAVIDHYKLQQEHESAYHVAMLRTHQDRGSTVTSHSIALGGGLVRNNIHAFLDGDGADATLNGLYLLAGTQHVDNHLRVEHAKPHCRSWEYYKGVLMDKSRGVFSGRIYVHPGAQKTDAKQTNMNLLLSDQAQIDTKPQLEIFADDVKCTHGATIGQIDRDALFYLRARGIREAAARDLLVYAFASESIEQVRIPSIRAQLEKLLFARLASGARGLSPFRPEE